MTITARQTCVKVRLCADVCTYIVVDSKQRILAYHSKLGRIIPICHPPMRTFVAELQQEHNRQLVRIWQLSNVDSAKPRPKKR